MSLFHNLLSELSKKIQGNEFFKDNIAKDISGVLGIDISPDQIKINKGEIFLNISPTLKTLVNLKKESLIISLKKYNITNIR